MSTSIKYLRMFMHLPDRSRRAIGYLSQYGDILRVSFDEDYISDPLRPVLSLTYVGQDEAATQAILSAARDARLVRADGHWPSYFANLLPEGHNRDRLARERHCAADDEFELLAAAGRDLMGALEVEPVPAREGIPDAVRLWHTALGLDVLEPGFVEDPVEDAAALPGVVTKFSAVYDGRRYVVRRQGRAGSTILKLPTSRHPDLVDNEYSGYVLCRALGLECAQAGIITRAQAELPEVVPFERILAVPRFDRGPDGLRVHMEEFAQVLGFSPRHKYGRGMGAYADMLRVIDAVSSRRAADLREFILRFVALILLGNTDAHLKNWALVYPDARHPQLAPLYDPVCVTAFFESVGPQGYGVNRRIDRELREFGWNDLDGLIRQAGLMRAPHYLRLARDLVRQAQAQWPALLKEAPPSMQRSVSERLQGGLALTR